jgi:hypothetical protein
VTARPDPFVITALLIAGFMLAGLAQAAWLSSAAARRLAWPLDAGLTIRGRRLFGQNKTVRGFVVMVPATAVSIAVVASLIGAAGYSSAIWPLDTAGFAVVGLVAGLGFMAGELPNSFIKRQLDGAPGAPAAGPLTGPLFALTDRLDSALGTLIALSLVVPVPWEVWALVLAIGPVVHGSYSALTYRMGGKARAA